MPHKNYHALRLFRGLLDTPRRIATHGAVEGQLALAAGLNADGTEASILVSNVARDQADYEVAVEKLPWSGPTAVETRRVDAQHNAELSPSVTNASSRVRVPLQLRSPAVALIRLRPVGRLE